MEEELLEPVSPGGQYFNSSVLSLCVHVILESEVPIDDSLAVQWLKDILLPINPRFSSIMVEDSDGRKHWKSVEVNFRNHIKIPTFPQGLQQHLYDNCFDEYLSNIAAERLPQSQPLWELHLIKYPTSNAAGNIIVKIHHAIGDGYSLMGALLSSLRRADDPSLPLTLPSIKPRSNTDHHNNIFERVRCILSTVFNTVSDFSWSLIKSSLFKDDRTPIRSGEDGVEFRPISVSTLTFQLDDIKQIKTKFGLTVNDVVAAIIFLGTRLYMQEMDNGSRNARSTALVILNTRMVRSYKSIEEMVKPDTDSPWGNRFTFLHVPIPKLTDADLLHPLSILKRTHEIIKRKRSSPAVYLRAWLLRVVNKFGGPKAAASYIHRIVSNSSMAITNMIGPTEKMCLPNHPIRGLYFIVAGRPQSLLISVVSYMGKLRVGLLTEKEFIDNQKLKSCLQRAFHMTLEAAACS